MTSPPAHVNPSVLPLITTPDLPTNLQYKPNPAPALPFSAPTGELLEGVRPLRAGAVVRAADRPRGDRVPAVAVRGGQERSVLAGRLGQAPPDGHTGPQPLGLRDVLVDDVAAHPQAGDPGRVLAHLRWGGGGGWLGESIANRDFLLLCFFLL